MPKLVEESDDYLVSQVVLNGSHAAYSVLVRRHQAAVRSSLSYLTHDDSFADDLAQDTFIRAYDRISQYQIGRSFKAWLGGIAYKEFLKAVRRSRNANKKLDLYTSNMIEEAADQDIGMSSIDLGRALELLNINEKTAVVLTYGLGMSHAEVSRTMDEPLGTVKSWVQRGKLKMRNKLESYSRDLDDMNHE